MSGDALGKNVCTVAVEASDAQHVLADLRDFAESYLLDSQQLPRDLAVGILRNLVYGIFCRRACFRNKSTHDLFAHN